MSEMKINNQDLANRAACRWTVEARDGEDVRQFESIAQSLCHIADALDVIAGKMSEDQKLCGAVRQFECQYGDDGCCLECGAKR